MKKLCFTTILALLLLVNAIAQKSAVFAPEGKAIKGYDPVAFLNSQVL